MKVWRVLRLVILVALVATAGWITYTKGHFGLMGSHTAQLTTSYKTERDWALQQTANDIREMVMFARHVQQPLVQTSKGLPATPWDIDAFATYASALLGDSTIPAEVPLSLHARLTDLNVRSIAASSDAATRALRANMLDPAAHEAAAIVIGAFALREAADLFTDVRWSLNRMTAHLAMARALRRDSPTSDGALALVVHSMLSHHQARAMAQINEMSTRAESPEVQAWLRAMKIRITQDWRQLAEPATATRLEKLEYFRARRATGKQRAAEDLEAVGEELTADFSRLGQNGPLGVEDGWDFTMQGLDAELVEAVETYRLTQSQPVPDFLSDFLNVRATRLIDKEPNVLPWGAWAEFYQRHIAMNIGRVDSYLRHMQGTPEDADEAARLLDDQLGRLTYFPLGTLRRTKGRAGTEADLRYVPGVVELSAIAPEVVTCPAWLFFESGSHAEPIPRSMSKATEFFATATREMPYEAGVRTEEGRGVKPQDVAAVIEEAPYDRLLLIRFGRGPVSNPIVARARALLADRADYDTTALETQLGSAGNEDQRLTMLKKSCEVGSRECSKYAHALVAKGQEPEAAKAFEKAFADPKLDAVALAADSGWLVDYYFRNKRHEEALALANKSAGSGSQSGLETRGFLLERLGRLGEAEQDYRNSAERYRWPAQLIGFYHRRVFDDRNPSYQDKYDALIAAEFPRGLQPVPTAMSAAPNSGVFVYKDSDAMRKAGIRAGDIIVGLEEWRVDSFRQWAAINAFKEDRHMKITLWRGTLLKIEAEQKGRWFGGEFQDYPLKGYMQP